MFSCKIGTFFKLLVSVFLHAAETPIVWNIFHQWKTYMIATVWDFYKLLSYLVLLLHSLLACTSWCWNSWSLVHQKYAVHKWSCPLMQAQTRGHVQVSQTMHISSSKKATKASCTNICVKHIMALCKMHTSSGRQVWIRTKEAEAIRDQLGAISSWKEQHFLDLVY